MAVAGINCEETERWLFPTFRRGECPRSRSACRRGSPLPVSKLLLLYSCSQEQADIAQLTARKIKHPSEEIESQGSKCRVPPARKCPPLRPKGQGPCGIRWMIDRTGVIRAEIAGEAQQQVLLLPEDLRGQPRCGLRAPSQLPQTAFAAPLHPADARAHRS